MNLQRGFKANKTNKGSNKIIKLKLEEYIYNIFSENSSNEYLTFDEFGYALYDFGMLNYLFNKNYQMNYSKMDLKLIIEFFEKESKSTFNRSLLEN